MCARTAQQVTRYVLRRGVRLQTEPISDEHVLLFPEGVVVLSDTAHHLLGHLREPCSARELQERAKQEYECGSDYGDNGESRMKEDIETFLSHAVQQRWVHIIPAVGA